MSLASEVQWVQWRTRVVRNPVAAPIRPSVPYAVASESMASYGESRAAGLRLAHFQGRGLELLHIGVPVVASASHHGNSSDLGGAVEGQMDGGHTCSTRKYHTCCFFSSHSWRICRERRR